MLSVRPPFSGILTQLFQPVLCHHDVCWGIPPVAGEVISLVVIIIILHTLKDVCILLLYNYLDKKTAAYFHAVVLCLERDTPWHECMELHACVGDHPL